MGAGAEDQACIRDLHFLLRYSDTLHGHDTIAEHSDVIRTRGYVWMGKFGLGIAQRFVAQVNGQAAGGRPSYVYLSSQSRIRYRGTLQEVRGGGVGARLVAPEAEFTPSYYAGTQCSIWFKLTRIAECAPDELLRLRLYNSPGLAPAFTSMRGLVYVTLGDGPAVKRVVTKKTRVMEPFEDDFGAWESDW